MRAYVCVCIRSEWPTKRYRHGHRHTLYATLEEREKKMIPVLVKACFVRVRPGIMSRLGWLRGKAVQMPRINKLQSLHLWCWATSLRERHSSEDNYIFSQQHQHILDNSMQQCLTTSGCCKVFTFSWLAGLSANWMRSHIKSSPKSHVERHASNADVLCAVVRCRPRVAAVTPLANRMCRKDGTIAKSVRISDNITDLCVLDHGMPNSLHGCVRVRACARLCFSSTLRTFLYVYKGWTRCSRKSWINSKIAYRMRIISAQTFCSDDLNGPAVGPVVGPNGGPQR